MTFNMDLWIINARGSGVLFLFWLGGRQGWIVALQLPV